MTAEEQAGCCWMQSGPAPAHVQATLIGAIPGSQWTRYFSACRAVCRWEIYSSTGAELNAV